jgi:protein SCO1/2
MKKILLLCISLIFCFPLCHGQNRNISNQEVEIGIVEQLDKTIPSDIFLTNEKGELVSLLEQIDKPTALCFVYFRCPGICSPLMDGVVDVIDKTDLELGKEYQLFTISFDPIETYDLAIKKKKNYTQLFDREHEFAEWKFFTGDSANIAKVTDAFGFRYKKIGNEYTHAAALILLSPEGKITRYLNGTYFLPFEFKLAVAEASKGKSGPTINKILQFCYSYDPVGQAYVLNITKVSGTIILCLGLFVFILLIFRKPKIKPKE